MHPAAAGRGGRAAPVTGRGGDPGSGAADILELGARLLANGVELVVMESTSDYWRIWYTCSSRSGWRSPW